MDETQHFCLRWNNYQSSITSAFENLRDDEDFVDVTIACDGRSLKAHRVVLSACSPYFRELLKSTPCKHPVIVLQDVAFADLHALVEFIYHGEVNVHQRNLNSFLKTAEVLRVSGLTQQHASEPPDRDEVHHSDIDTKTFLQNSGLNSRHLFGIDKDGHFATPGSSPLAGPGGATVNQLLRRAAQAAARRERHNSADDGGVVETKRAKHHHHGGSGGGGGGSGGGSSTDSNHIDSSATVAAVAAAAAAADFSIRRSEDADSPSSQLDGNSNNGVKSEPTDIISTELGADSDQDNSGEEGAGGGSGGGNGGGLDVIGGDDGGGGDSKTSSAAAFLHDSKLFQQGQGSYNFTLAALADPAALSGLGNQALQAAAAAAAGSAAETGGGGAGTSATQGTTTAATNNNHHSTPKKVFNCELCGKVLCSKASLKRHIADKHAVRHEEYRCVVCERVYCSRNSLMTHIYTYHKTRPGEVDIKFY